jgi:hypothetical protein
MVVHQVKRRMKDAEAKVDLLVKKVMVRRMIEKLMEVDLLVVNQMKKPIVLIMMKEEIVVNQVVIDHRSMELNK